MFPEFYQSLQKHLTFSHRQGERTWVITDVSSNPQNLATMKLTTKLLSSLLLIFSGFNILASSVQEPAMAQVTAGRFIVNSLSGKCIDVAGAPGNSNGAPLQLWDCETSGKNADNGSTTDQQWSIIR